MTVLQALDGYYGRMAARGEVASTGCSREKIGFAIVLAPDGRPVDLLDLRTAQGERLIPRLLDVPTAVKRTAGIQPNLFWDKSSYVVGRTAGEGRKTAEQHAAFKAVHLKMLDKAVDKGLVALRRFLETWTAERLDAAPFRAEILDANLVFKLSGEPQFIHEHEAARRLLESRAADDAPRVFCLATGAEAPVARLHPTIKGVDGAQASGAALVSFNLDAFRSYGHAQGDNAPTSVDAAFRYGAALNRLLDRDSRNRLSRPLGDATVVFWADASSAVSESEAKAAEAVFASSAEPPKDADEAAKVRAALDSLAAGKPVELEGEVKISPGVRFNVLGLSPNGARLYVRFWLSDSLDIFAKRLADHYRDIAIAPEPWGARPPSISRLLVKTTSPQEKFENIPPRLAGELASAVLSGGRYPSALLTAVLMRLRAGDDPGTGWHAAVIRAVLARDHRRRTGEEAWLMSLQRDLDDTAYQLGRLFAAVETAQRLAMGRLNATVRDRYFGAASATPARVFPLIMRGVQYHLGKLRRLGKGLWIEREIAEIVDRLPPSLPRSLRLEAQGRFAIGYYHQRKAQFATFKERRRRRTP